MLVCLVALTITFLLITLYSILQANADLLPMQAARYLSIKILDTSSAASLFVTLLGALLVRHQFALSLLPRINYQSAYAIKNDPANANVSFETWRVEVRNSGLGAAIIISTTYQLELSDDKNGTEEGHTHTSVVEALAKAGLVRNVDYWLANNSTGFALPPKDDVVVFEIKAEQLFKIKRLDMELQFQDQLGGRYGREIFLVPSSIKPKIETAQG